MRSAHAYCRAMHALGAPLTINTSVQELLALFDVGNAWQIEVIVLGMPGWVKSRDWAAKEHLGDLYARAELPVGVHQAALEKLLASGDVSHITSPRASDLCKVLHTFAPRRVHGRPAQAQLYGAVEYLCTATLPLISHVLAKSVLASLTSITKHCTDLACELQLLDALRLMSTHQISFSEPVIYFAVKLNPESGGVDCDNLGSCIEDMLDHYLRQENRFLNSPRPHLFVREPWTGYLCPKSV